MKIREQESEQKNKKNNGKHSQKVDYLRMYPRGRIHRHAHMYRAMHKSRLRRSWHKIQQIIPH